MSFMGTLCIEVESAIMITGFGKETVLEKEFQQLLLWKTVIVVQVVKTDFLNKFLHVARIMGFLNTKRNFPISCTQILGLLTLAN